MIVKVQMPVSSNEPAPLALVYNRDRSVLLQVDASIVSDVMRGRFKAYFHADIEGETLQIDREAPWQTW